MNYFRILCIAWLAVLPSSALAGRPSPAEGDTLNYTHVLFQWEQQPDAVAYQLQVAVNDVEEGADPFVSSLVTDVIDSTLLRIVTDGLDWDQPYIWRVRPLDEDGETGDWGGAHKFFTAELPEIVVPLNVTMYDSTDCQPGITVFDIMNSGYLVAIDKQAKPIWFMVFDPIVAGLKDPKWLPNGNLIACCSGSGSTPSCWELTIDGDIIWEDPKLDVELTAVVKLANGNYLGQGHHRVYGPIPDGPWTPDFEEAEIDSFQWDGDKFVEYDPDNNIVWSWDCFDYFSFADYDSATFSKALKKGYHDWTHGNYICYDPVEDAVYLSIRNLDRITKIDHKTGDVIWNMGRDMPSGQVAIGHDLKFSKQHTVDMLENGNLMTLDNGKGNTPQVSRALEIKVTETATDTTAEIVWQYVLPDSLYTSSNGDSDRLLNGNTLITCRDERNLPEHGYLLEIDTEKNYIWMAKLETEIIYSAERVLGLYPQAFSVIRPVFGPDLAEPCIFLPVGQATIQYELHNEGWLDETYNYQLLDRSNWFEDSGSVDVAAGERATLSFSGNVLLDVYPDKIQLVVTPSQAPARAVTTFLYVYATQSSVTDETGALPQEFALRQNYPNPFNPETNISFDLPEDSEVKIGIYNIQGRLVRELLDERRNAGRYVIRWNGKDNAGNEAASGIYFYELRTEGFVDRKRMVLVK